MGLLESEMSVTLLSHGSIVQPRDNSRDAPVKIARERGIAHYIVISSGTKCRIMSKPVSILSGVLGIALSLLRTVNRSGLKLDR